MAYADLDTIQTTDPGDILTAAWCDQARDNEEFLIDPPTCSIFNSTAQANVPTATVTAMTADSENYDNDSMHSTASNTSRITIQTAGRYRFTGVLQYEGHATGARALLFRKNGTTTYNAAHVATAGAAVSTNLSGTRTATMAAGDYMEVIAFHSAGVDLDVTLEEFAAKFDTR